MNHTPGPWSYDGHGINSIAESHKGERIFKTCLDYSHNSPDRERAIADSNLAAAAPELLEAIKALSAQAYLTMTGGHQNLLDDAWAAIAKAEGRST